MRTVFIAACLAIVAAQGASAEGPDFAQIRRDLNLGYWNARINALYELEDAGPRALPLLTYASQDADWQVRQAAAHFLGRTGPEAAGALAALAESEPCPEVRLSALKSLAAMGEPARRYYDEAADPSDEALLAENPDRFGNEHMGKPLIIDAPEGEMTRSFFEGSADLRICASSERSGHQDEIVEPRPSWMVSYEAPVEASQEKRALPASTPDLEVIARAEAESGLVLTLEPESLHGIPATPSRDESYDPRAGTAVVARPAPALDVRRGGIREGLGGIPVPPERDHSYEPQARLAMTAPPTLALGEIAAMRGQKERMRGLTALPRRETLLETADLEDDAGTGREEFDRIPVLIERLQAGEARRRALAAELLGKRGAEAYAAVPALRRALKDPERRVRASAALALGDIGASERGVRADLKRALRDKSEDVRSSALLALKMIESPR